MLENGLSKGNWRVIKHRGQLPFSCSSYEYSPMCAFLFNLQAAICETHSLPRERAAEILIGAGPELERRWPELVSTPGFRLAIFARVAQPRTNPLKYAWISVFCRAEEVAAYAAKQRWDAVWTVDAHAVFEEMHERARAAEIDLPDPADLAAWLKAI
jgi:hypothetical protein